MVSRFYHLELEGIKDYFIMLDSYFTLKFVQAFHRAKNANTLYFIAILAHLSERLKG